MRERIDVRNFEKAIRVVLQRHDALRSRFEMTEKGPAQWFASPKEVGEVPFSMFDLRHFPRHLREEKAQELATAQARHPFRLNEEAPIRFSLVQLDRELFRLYLCAHHLVIDGVAIYQVFLPELETAYRSLLAGRKPAF